MADAYVEPDLRHAAFAVARLSLYRPRLLTLIVLLVVTAPIVVANLSHDPRPPIENGKGWPPPNPSYGWPLIWYWCAFKPSSPARIGGGVHYEMHTEVVEWSGPRLAGNVAIWLVIAGVVGYACQWLLRRYGPRRGCCASFYLTGIGGESLDLRGRPDPA